MTDPSDTDDTSVTNRLDSLEDDMQRIDERVGTIEEEQEHLQGDLERVVEMLREQGDQTAHIDSVRALYKRIENLERNTEQIRQMLEEVIDDPR